jgi:hypothetical protein
MEEVSKRFSSQVRLKQVYERGLQKLIVMVMLSNKKTTSDELVFWSMRMLSSKMLTIESYESMKTKYEI